MEDSTFANDEQLIHEGSHSAAMKDTMVVSVTYRTDVFSFPTAFNIANLAERSPELGTNTSASTVCIAALTLPVAIQTAWPFPTDLEGVHHWCFAYQPNPCLSSPIFGAAIKHAERTRIPLPRIATSITQMPPHHSDA